MLSELEAELFEVGQVRLNLQIEEAFSPGESRVYSSRVIEPRAMRPIGTIWFFLDRPSKRGSSFLSFLPISFDCGQRREDVNDSFSTIDMRMWIEYPSLEASVFLSFVSRAIVNSSYIL